MKSNSLKIIEKLNEEFINKINNEPFPNELYHFTNAENLYQLLKSNKLRGMNNNQVSFTSDESYWGNGFQPLERVTAELAFDANKMAQDYTIERYVYDLDSSAEYDDYVNEFEWIIKGDFENLNKYLLYITFEEEYISNKDINNIKNDFPNLKIEKW